MIILNTPLIGMLWLLYYDYYTMINILYLEYYESFPLGGCVYEVVDNRANYQWHKYVHFINGERAR